MTTIKRSKPINQKNADFMEQVADRMEDMQLEGRSLWQDAKRRFFRNKAAVASLVILFLILLFISFAPLFFPFTYEDTDWNMMSTAPTLEGYHFFGTDSSGRDLLVRTAIGGRISLLVGIAGALISVCVGRYGNDAFSGNFKFIPVHVFRYLISDLIRTKYSPDFRRYRCYCLAWSCTYCARANPQSKK